ncbi:hypothetical protein GJ496_002648 [Pomphorhynchus laevis]|nr:hypothetical protein GJ496_002648 [Pomphorhynchus laevis]
MSGVITKSNVRKLIMVSIFVSLTIYYHNLIRVNRKTFAHFKLSKHITVKDISTNEWQIEDYDQKCEDGSFIHWISTKSLFASKEDPTVIAYNKLTTFYMSSSKRSSHFVVMYTLEAPPHVSVRSKYYDFAITYDWETSYPFAHTYFSEIDIYLKSLLLTPQNIEERKGIVWLCGNCEAFNRRQLFVKELMNHIHVDSYGLCLNNVGTQRRYDGNSTELYESYKYVIAIENSNCRNYNHTLFMKRHFSYKRKENPNVFKMNSNQILKWCKNIRFAHYEFSKHLLVKESGHSMYCKIHYYLKNISSSFDYEDISRLIRDGEGIGNKHNIDRCLPSTHMQNFFKL